MGQKHYYFKRWIFFLFISFFGLLTNCSSSGGTGETLSKVDFFEQVQNNWQACVSDADCILKSDFVACSCGQVPINQVFSEAYDEAASNVVCESGDLFCEPLNYPKAECIDASCRLVDCDDAGQNCQTI